MQEILRDVSRFLSGYNGIVQTYAMGITQECGSLPVKHIIMLHYDGLYYAYKYDIKLVH